MTSIHSTDFHAIWLSDIHLGCKDCKADLLLQFLNRVTTRHLFLVGDILDIWALKKRVYWPESHNQVLQKILEIARSNTQVVFIPGNHDELLKSYHYLSFANIEIKPYFLHHTIAGKALLMVHGDQFDSEVCVSQHYAKLGDHLYDFLLFLNRNLHKLRKKFGRSYWSLASYIKNKVPRAQQAIERYHQAAIRYAQSQNVDAIFCGHIHQPALLEQSGIIYGNQGDWIENCTLLAETQIGELELLQWDDSRQTYSVINSLPNSVSKLHAQRNSSIQQDEVA